MGIKEAWVSGSGTYAYQQWSTTGTGIAGNGCGSSAQYSWTIDGRTNMLLALGSSESGSWNSMKHDSAGLNADYTAVVAAGYNTKIWRYMQPVKGGTPIEKADCASAGCWLFGGIQMAYAHPSSPVVDTSTDIDPNDTLTTVPGGAVVGMQGSRSSGASPTNLTELQDRGCWTSSPCGVSRGISFGWNTTSSTSLLIGYNRPGLSGATSGASFKPTPGGSIMVVLSKLTPSPSILERLSDFWRRLLDEMIMDPAMVKVTPEAFPDDYWKRNKHYENEYEKNWTRALWEYEVSR